MANIKKSKIVNRTGGVETDDGRTLYGFDAEVYQRMKSKEDPQYERKIGEWIEKIIEPEKLVNNLDLFTSLKDGLVLCKLMNIINKGIIPKYSTKRDRNGALHPLMERENITLYLEACWKIGIASDSMFIVADLHSRRGMTAVFNNLSALSNLAPAWGVKVEPVGLMRIPLASDSKKPEQQSKWSVNLPQGASYTEQAEDDVEALEEEVHSLKMLVEESQRTISKLEHSKTNLADLLKVERKKNMEHEKELNVLRKDKGGGFAHQQKYVEDLKKEKDVLQKELQLVKKESGNNQGALTTLKKDLEETLAIKKQLEEKLSKGGDQTVIDKLKTRIKELEKENIDLMSQASVGSGSGDTSPLISKIKLLEDEKNRLIQDYDKKITQLNSTIQNMDEEMTIALQSIEEIEEEKNKAFEERNEMTAKVEETLRMNRQNMTLEFTKLQNDIEQLKNEKNLISQEYENAKKSMETQINAAKNEAKTKSEESAKEIDKLKKHKEKLIKEKEEAKLETDNELAAVKKKYDDQLRDYRKEVEKLQKEKLAVSEKMFEETRRLTQELYEKDSLLQESAGETKGKSGESSSKEVSSLKRELKHIQEQYELERQKLLQERSDVLQAVESQLSAEKKKVKNLTSEIEKVKAKAAATAQEQKELFDADIDELFYVADCDNKDGRITFEEFHKFIEKLSIHKHAPIILAKTPMIGFAAFAPTQLKSTGSEQG